MKKFTLPLILLITLSSLWCEAQYKSPGSKNNKSNSNSAAGLPLSERLFFGGGGSFGSGISPIYGRYTTIYVSPLVGYRVTLPFAVGVGVNYTFFKFSDVNVRQDQYGISPFLQYRFGKLFAYAEYSMISVPSYDNSFRQIYSRLPVGLGFTQPIGSRAAINAMALYDVLYNKRTTAFASPWVLRVFVTAGGVSF